MAVTKKVPSKAKSKAKSSSNSNPLLRLKRRPFNKVSAGILMVALVAVGYLVIRFSSAATACTVDTHLVNPCRPWIGAYSGMYTQVANDPKSQLLYHEQRLGHQLDVAHVYNKVGANSLSPAATYFINRPNTYLMQGWKPASTWAAAANGSADAGIDQMISSIKSVAPNKLFLTIWHEPENDVSSGNCTSNANGASAGSPADYVNMWHHVRAKFDAAGVNNVVWVMNYMSFSKWDCLVPLLWPGNADVDWVNWDPYATGTESWDIMCSRFYNFLSQSSDATHNYLSKTWGLNEVGTYSMDNAHRYAFWDGAKASTVALKYPRLKMILGFDSTGSLGDHRVAYGSNGVLDPVVQQYYNAFGTAVMNIQPTPTPTPTSTPTPTPTATARPVDSSAPTMPGAFTATLVTQDTVALGWSASSDNVGVTGYRVYRDEVLVSNDTKLSFVDSGRAVTTAYAYAVEAYDAAGNVSSRSTLSATTLAQVSNGGGGTGPVVITPPGTTDPIAIPTTSSPQVGGTIKISTGSTGTSKISVDSLRVSSNGLLDTTYLTNGTHTVSVAQNGQTSTRTVVVSNKLSLLQSFRNTLFAPFHGNKGAVNLTLIIIVALSVGIFSWFGFTATRSYRFGS